VPRQNRVDPFGILFRSPARGAIMGNRGGALHNDRGEIVRPFKGQRWIACLLEFKSIRRQVMKPGFYTELFFLDEASSFAAGHRPCAECRRERFNAFRAAWGGTPSAPAMDAELHRARVDASGRKVTFPAPLDSLPDGAFVQIDDSAWLVWGDGLYLWTPASYERRIPRNNSTVTVLTPAPSIECFRRGYRPEVTSLP
jgi:hypothetical protein